MITENKLKHMLGVARKCYRLALEYGKTEDEARSYWVMGLLHDIGYEFAEDPRDHEEVGYQILHTLGSPSLTRDFTWNLIESAIRQHGNSNMQYEDVSLYLRILVEADFKISTDGKECTVEERMKEIGERYGTDSETYRACERQCWNMRVK